MVKFIISRTAVDKMLFIQGRSKQAPSSRLNELDRHGRPTGNLICLVHQTETGLIAVSDRALLREAVSLTSGLVYMCCCYPGLVADSGHPRLKVVGGWVQVTHVHSETRSDTTATLVIEEKRGGSRCTTM